ncbi:MAG: DUF4169 family protein [Xanthobacter sp.]
MVASDSEHLGDADFRLCQKADRKALAERLEEIVGDVINLHRVRKTRDRKAEKVQAEENRIRFGRTKVECKAHADAEERQRRHLEGHALSGRENDEKPRG